MRVISSWSRRRCRLCRDRSARSTSRNCLRTSVALSPASSPARPSRTPAGKIDPERYSGALLVDIVGGAAGSAVTTAIGGLGGVLGGPVGSAGAGAANTVFTKVLPFSILLRVVKSMPVLSANSRSVQLCASLSLCIWRPKCPIAELLLPLALMAISLARCFSIRHPLLQSVHTFRCRRENVAPARRVNPANAGGGVAKTEVSQVSQGESDDVGQLDDFEVVEERRRVMVALAGLTDKYRRLNAEMTRRETLRWMVRADG